jgi:hypothetical protein
MRSILAAANMVITTIVITPNMPVITIRTGPGLSRRTAKQPKRNPSAQTNRTAYEYPGYISGVVYFVGNDRIPSKYPIPQVLKRLPAVFKSPENSRGFF